MKNQTPARNSRIILLAIIANVIWSTAFFTAKIALSTGCGPWTLAGLRSVAAGIILLIWNRNIARDLAQIRRHFAQIALIALFQTFLAFLLIYYGLNLVQGAVAAIVIGTGPVLSAVLAHLFLKNDRLTPKSLIALALGFFGVLLLSLTAKPWTPEGLVSLGGIGLILAGVLCGSYTNILIVRAHSGLNFLALNYAQMLLGGIPLLAMGLLLEKAPQNFRPAVFIPALAWLVMISAVPTTIWAYLLKVRKAKISEINLWVFIAPVLGALLSWAILPGENPTTGAVAGMALIGFSLIFYYRRIPGTGWR